MKKFRMGEFGRLDGQARVEVEYREPIDYGENKGTYSTLGDDEHAELIKDYVEGKGGMAKIAEVHGVSSGTVHNHVKKHNKEVGTSGECSMCRHAGSEFSKEVAKRPRAPSHNLRRT